jgi:hypothetical protein
LAACTGPQAQGHRRSLSRLGESCRVPVTS